MSRARELIKDKEVSELGLLASQRTGSSMGDLIKFLRMGIPKKMSDDWAKNPKLELPARKILDIIE